MKWLAKLCFAAALITGASVLAVAPVSAATSITVSPAIVQVAGAAGTDGRLTISVTNSGDAAFDIVTGVSMFQEMDGNRSAAEWTSVRPPRMHLAPGASRSATVRMRIPDDIASGGRYAAVTFATVPPRSDENVTSISGRIAVPILLAVRGDGPLTSAAVVERFAPSVEADGRLGFRAQLRNDGNVHVPMAGSVTVALPGQEPYASVDIGERILLPQASRLLTSQTTLPLPLGERYQASATFVPTSAAVSPDAQPISVETEFDSTPRLTLVGDGICENLDRGPTIHGDLSNPGDVALLPALRFEVLDGAGVLVGSANPPEAPVVWPGQTLQVTSEFAPRLASGSYMLVTTATYGPDLVLERATPFSIGGDPATAAPVCSAGDAVSGQTLD